MASKLLKRIQSDRISFNIDLTIHKVSITVVEPYNMSVTIKRGPQKQEFLFEADPHNKDTVLEQSFKRDSGFYRNKNGQF